MKSLDLESDCDIKSKDIKNAVKGVVAFVSENPNLKNKLFNEEFPLFLQINSFKIPKAHGPVKQVFRVPLANCPLPSDADICLIVPDVKGIPNKEHERHIEHYETLLRLKDVTCIKKIMTFHEFRTEYETFELKSRLADLYDIFLVDGRISGKVVHKCGKIFYKKRKVPVAIKLHLPKLKSHIEQSLNKAYLQLHLKSDSHCVQIGHSKMSTKSLVENVHSVIEFINKQFPGKMDNIRSLNVYAYRGTSIPIYVSLKNPNDIKVPVLSAKKPKAYKSVSGELTTQYNADVVVRPSGEVIVRRGEHKNAKSNQNHDDKITDTEVVRENKKIDQKEEKTSYDGNNTRKGKKRKHSGLEDTNKSIMKTVSETNSVKKEKPKPDSKVDVKVEKGVEATKYKEENKLKKKKAKSTEKMGYAKISKSKIKKRTVAS